MAILGITGNVARAQSELPALPDSLPASTVNQGQPLLPYPFAPAVGSPTVSPQFETKVVGILGLSAGPPTSVASNAMPNNLAPQPSRDWTAPPPAVPVLGPKSPIALVTNLVTKTTDSLIDIDIPLPGMQPAASESGTRLSLSDAQPDPIPLALERAPKVVRKGGISPAEVPQEQTLPPARAVAQETMPMKDLVDPASPAGLPPLVLPPPNHEGAAFHLRDDLDEPDTSTLSLSDKDDVKTNSRMRLDAESESTAISRSNGSQAKPTLGIAIMPTLSTIPAPLAAQSKRVEALLASSSHTGVVPKVFADQDTVVGVAMAVRQHEVIPVAAESSIVEYSTEHPSICKLIKTSDNTLSLVGLATGETRIAIVTQTKSIGRRVEIRDVKVGDVSDARAGLQTLAVEISRTTAGLYPHSKVEVVSNGEQLVVQGLVQSESEARKILAFVRKATLTPVIDRLQSRSN